MNISKEKFLEYVRIKKSGKTNMFAVSSVVALSGGKLSREDCLDIMENYDKYEKSYS